MYTYYYTIICFGFCIYHFVPLRFACDVFTQIIIKSMVCLPLVDINALLLIKKMHIISYHIVSHHIQLYR
jgi:hypothetical protein